MTDKIAVVSINGDDLGGLEGETSRRVMRHLLSAGSGKSFDYFETDSDALMRIRDLHAYGRYDVYVILNGTVFIPHESINILSKIISGSRTLSAVAPVSNESAIAQQKHAPSFIYQTISVLRLAAEETYGKFRDTVVEVDAIDNFCFALRRKSLDGLPADCTLTELPEVMKANGLEFGIAKGVYAHRYGNCYESGRNDLMEYVPLEARDILDIGSARGLFGELLKKRQKCTVTGVDSDNEMTAFAGNRLDRAMCGDIGEILDKGLLETYDCIVCGDILEHLNNPWKIVKGLRDHLKPGGIFIASTPNITNWSILFELLRGRWDYVPFSILSGTHVRFFTRQTLTEFFEDAGYTIKKVHLQRFEIPPQGIEFIEHLRNISPGVNEEELRTSEIVIVAGA